MSTVKRVQLRFRPLELCVAVPAKAISSSYCCEEAARQSQRILGNSSVTNPDTVELSDTNSDTSVDILGWQYV